MKARLPKMVILPALLHRWTSSSSMRGTDTFCPGLSLAQQRLDFKKAELTLNVMREGRTPPGFTPKKN